MKKNLIICAHFDDEVLGCSSILKNSDVLVVCGNDVRKEISEKISKSLDVKYYLLDYEPHNLQFESQNILCDKIKEIAKAYKNIYTHNSADLHKDHQVVSNCVDVVCRSSRSNFEKLYHFFIETDFQTNTYIQISKYQKELLLDVYKDFINENLRTLSITDGEYNGVKAGLDFCERFKLIYDIRRN